MKKVLVTGGAGFIGSHLCGRLLATPGVEVSVIDNFSLGREANIASYKGDRFTVHRADITDRDFVERLFDQQRFDTVFHLAANSDIGRSFENPEVDYTNTFEVTYRVLDCMRKFGCRQLMFASTSAIYGEVTKPVNEDFGPLFPISHYGAAKLASEAFIASFAASYQIRAHIYRFPNVVGDRATHGVIYDFLRKIQQNKEELVVLGDGSQEKPYLHVSDLLEAILSTMATDNGLINYYNVAGLDTATVKRIAGIVLEVSGQDRRIRYTGGERGWVGDVPKFRYDQQKILSTGWRPTLDSEAAIRKTVRDILANGEIEL